MPKGKRKGRSDRHRVDGSSNTSDDESLLNDNISIISNFSEEIAEEQQQDGAVNDIALDQDEDKLSDIIDGLTQKSSQGRTNCYQTFTKALVKKYMPGFIRDRNYTLCDCIERSLKKGGGAEKRAAADLATVMCVQLGAEEGTEEICRNLKPVLLTSACDNSVAAPVRATCVTALGSIAFLSGGEMGEVLLLMQQFQTIYAGSFLRGDGSVPNITPETAALHAAALNSWALLFTLMVPGNIGTMISNSKSLPSLEQLSELLESLHLEVRMAAGEALALIFELGREESEDFAEDFAVDVTETLKQLATDSHKYRAKKDRKQQRATFRDILNFIENDIAPEMQVKFGKEVLLLDTWVRRKQYEALCSILGPGINVHLAENELLRDILEITASLDLAEAGSKMPAYAQHQMERHRKRIVNAANFKARTISRAKNRDKRSDF